VDDLKKQYEEGKSPDLSKIDPHAVTGILKLYLRELPTPLLTYELFDQFISTCRISVYSNLLQLDNDDPNHRAEKLQPLVAQLPAPNKETLKQLMNMCSNITRYVEKNKMNASNLATVLGPNLIYSKDQNPLSIQNYPIITVNVYFT
jgi:hypothetical protein